MQVSAGPRATGWQGAYVPQLKYRNPIPSDDGSEFQNSSASTGTAQRQPGPAIRDIRLAMSQPGQQPGQNKSPPRSLTPRSVENFSRTPPKKKSSLFGGLFAVKEPTQVALNQVAAQIIAQHGSTSAGKVPNVSMEKMPQHVPRVNAKWDGVPDAVKQREKERARTANRESLTSSTIRSRSSEQSRRPLETRSSQNSDKSRSNCTRSQHSNVRKRDSFAPNPHRFYAQSVNSSGDLAAQQRPEEESRPSSTFSHPASLQSASSRSLADAGVFPDDIPPPPKAPISHRRTGSRPQNAQKRASTGPPVDAVPGQTRSPATATREGSPMTLPQQAHESQTERRDKLPMGSAKPDTVSLPTARVPARPNAAFLAGEAQEFQVPNNDAEQSSHSYGAAPMASLARPADIEKRPDSSRDRLGLRANMVVKGNKPWETKPDTSYERPPSADDQTNAQLKPKKTISKAFGALLKREM